MRGLLVVALVVPGVALADAAVDALASNPGAALAAGLGAFAAGLVRDAVALRRHEQACPVRNPARSPAVNPQ